MVSFTLTSTKVMHDPFSMRPFFGYNFGDYLQHWLDMGSKLKKPPQFFMVNWFRKGQNGGLLWPGFGDNIRVIQWILGYQGKEIYKLFSPHQNIQDGVME